MARRARIYIIAAIIAGLIFFSILAGGGTQFASAAASSYTNVLTDLTADENFNASEYPENVKDYSLKVIQIAESVDDELFIYVYQPSGQRVDLKASSINIARSENNSLEMSFPNYNLTLVNSNGVFYKYKVEDFELEKTDVRYYNISNILRPFNSKIDREPSAGQTKTEVKNEVGQLWTVRTVKGNVEYAVTTSEVITITQKYVGYLQYFNGIDLDTGNVNPDTTASSTIRHIVAFSTDHQIDRLVEVEIEYSLQEWQFELCANIVHSISGENHNYKDIINNFPVLDPETLEEVPPTKVNDVIKGKRDSNKVNGWFGSKYTWDTIQTTSDFLKANENNKLTNTAGVSSIEGTQWVLSFYTQTVDMVNRGNVATSNRHFIGEYNEVTDVIILRLMFEVDGDTYNLGVVDNKQTGDKKPLNSPTLGNGSGCAASWEWLNVLPWWGWVLIILFAPAAIALVVFLLYQLLVWAFKSISRKIRERRELKEEERHVKLQQEKNMRLKKHQSDLDRKENKRQRKLDEKDKKAWQTKNKRKTTQKKR